MSEPDDLFGLPLSGRDFDLQAARLIAALQGQKLQALEEWKEDFKKELKADYVCRHEFRPVMRLVYGMASVMLVALVGAIVNSVLKAHL